MSAAAAPTVSNPAPGLDPGLVLQLPADAYHHLIRTLCLTLPSPPGDTPEDRLRRDHAAIACVAGLVPANAAEAELAAQFVAATEQWKDYLRLARLTGISPEREAKCRAEASGMMRHANAAMRLLLRLQEARRKQERDPAACNRMAWTEHCAAGLMVQALAAPSAPAPAAPLAEPEPSEAPADAAPEPAETRTAPAAPAPASPATAAEPGTPDPTSPIRPAARPPATGHPLPGTRAA